MKFRHIIFDWSGTVNNNLGASVFAANYVLTHYGLPPMSLTEVRERWRQPYMLFYNQFLPNLTIEEENQFYDTGYPMGVEKFPPTMFDGMKELLSELRAREARLAIISSDRGEFLRREMEAYGVGDYFFVVETDIHDKMEILKHIIKNHGFSPRETVFIGDTVHEVECGKAAGIFTAAVDWGFQARAHLEAARPDFLCRSVGELRVALLG